MDLVMDATDLLGAPSHFQTYDAGYLSHSLEHFTPQDVPRVLSGARYALKPGGTIEVRVPDIGAVNALLDAGADVNDVAYRSPAGPITFADMIDGWSPAIAAGNEHYRHRTGFTADRLCQALVDAGFEQVTVTSANLELEAHAVAPN